MANVELKELIDKYEEYDLVKLYENFNEVKNKLTFTIIRIKDFNKSIMSLETPKCPGTDIVCVNFDHEKNKKVKKRLQTELHIETTKSNSLDEFKKELEIDYNSKKQQVDICKELKKKYDVNESNKQHYKGKLKQDEWMINNINKRLKEKQKEYDKNCEDIGLKTLVLDGMKKKLSESNSLRNRYKEITEEIKSIQNRLAKGREFLLTLQEQIGKEKVKLHILKDSIEKNKRYKKELNSLDDEKRLLTYCIKMYGNHIPHLLLENALPEIENYSKRFLNKLSKGRMDIEFRTKKTLKTKDINNEEKIKETFDLILTLDDKKYNYALFSGGEKSRADVALHLAYSMYLLNRSGAKLETLFLDEVCSALDEEGKEILIEILKELMVEGYFKKIFLITQDQTLKKMIDDVLIVVKTENGSMIRSLYGHRESTI